MMLRIKMEGAIHIVVYESAYSTEMNIWGYTVV